MIRTKFAATAIAATALLGLSACSSGVKVAGPSKTTASPTGNSSTGGGTGNTTAGGGGTPSAECQKVYAQFAAAMAGASTGNSAQDAKTMFTNLEKVVPDNLKAAAKTIATAYGKYFDLLAKYNGDTAKAMQDPEVVKELQAVASPDVAAASQQISDYFSSQCKG